MAKKLENMSAGELAVYRYKGVESSHAAMHTALIECALDFVKCAEDPNLLKAGEHTGRAFQFLVDYLNVVDKNQDRLSTVGITRWITDIAGLRISKNGRVWPSKKIEHDRQWLKDLRENQPSWHAYTKKLVVTKPISDPHDTIVRQLATFIAMGGMTADDAKARYPEDYKDIVATLKNEKFVDTIAGKMEYLIDNNLPFIKE